MTCFADLHVHSKYSRATSRSCDVPHLALWAQKKGISLLGTGDFTHPGWRVELQRDLVEAEPGLFAPRPEVLAQLREQLHASCRSEVRFLLQAEISTIYKRGERTRKVHHVVLAPDFASVERMAEKLGRIGNLVSDGRPILGLDSRDLLEIVLESGQGCSLIPAHIWTPWFAVLGSKSGFDAVRDCYGELTSEICAVETGLSSDPAMNWRVSGLDRFRLLSNSDAHSPPKLGRNACVFRRGLDYFGLLAALRTGRGYVGTVEFFPEEGKYHLDGHRKCGQRLRPSQTRALQGRCPVCGKALTVGVMHRVEELADRPEGGERPATAGEVLSLIPLPEILSEILGVGAQSKRVSRAYEALLARLGPELPLLAQLPLDDIERAGGPLLAEGIARLRRGQVRREAGFDGQFGSIGLFERGELQGTRGALLFDLPRRPRPAAKRAVAAPVEEVPPHAQAGAHAQAQPQAASEAAWSGALAGLDPEQRTAAERCDGALLIVAGPGSGKTRTLTCRIAHMVAERGVAPERCLTISFTRRAAEELRERLVQLLPGVGQRVPVSTFHSLGLELLRQYGERLGLPRDFRVADEERCLEILERDLGLTRNAASRCSRRIGLARRGGEADEALAAQLAAYERAMLARGLADFDQLLTLPVALLERDLDLRRSCRERYTHLSLDEYQDIDALQYRLVRLLAGEHVCAIGDPDQAIYGFRGSDVGFFRRFESDWPGCHVQRLARNYRSGKPIVQAATDVVTRARPELRPVRALAERPELVALHAAPSDKAEAEFVVHSIEQLLGGHSFFSLDSGRALGSQQSDLSFSDFAVFYRTEALSEALVEAFARSGMPFQRRSHERLTRQPGVAALVARLEEGEGDPQELLLRAAKAQVAQEPDTAATTELALDLLRPLAQASARDQGRFLGELTMGVEADSWDPRAQRISLLTLHASKGLEYRVVFILGCEDGILPLRFGPQLEPEALEEERRLLYVGMTRARERLFLCRAERRSWRGKLRQLPVSPFLGDIREKLLESWESQAPRRAAEERCEQLMLF